MEQLDVSEWKGEQEFFKLLFLSAMLNTPHFMLDSVTNLCPFKLYERAKYIEKLQFNQFAEWIDKEI